jgi:branched-chain amino acid transport system substrate-binding protein
VRTPRTRRARALAALAVLAFATATACAQPGEQAGAGAPPAPPASEALLGPAAPATGTPLRVGLFNVEGNPRADLSSTGDAAEAAAAYANEHLGGLDGHPIEVVRCADQIDLAAAQACAQEFLDAGVVAVVAGQPATSDAVLPQMAAAGIPWVGSSPLSQAEIGTESAYFFGSGAVGLLGAYARYADDLGYRNVVLYGLESPQVTALVETVGRPLFARAGINLRLVSVPGGGADATARIDEGLADEPDAVAVIGERTSCQSILAGLYALQATPPKLVGSGCVDRAVIEALGESAIDNAVVFGVGDPSGTHQEAQVYRAVMQTYAPAAEPSGLTTAGYVSMLGFVRAINAAGLPDGPIGGDQITGALRAARDVLRPLGNSSTFSCDRSQLPPQLVQATICTSEVLYATYTGGVPGRYNKIDIAPAFGG